MNPSSGPLSDSSGPREVQASATWARTAIAIGCLLLIGTGLAGVGAAMIPLSVAIGFLVLASLCFAPVSVRADSSGVEILFGAWRWPKVHVPAKEILGAKAVQVRPMAQGGWGYRGSLKRMGRAALVIRGGEGIQLDLTGGRRLVLALPGISSLTEVINQLDQP